VTVATFGTATTADLRQLDAANAKHERSKANTATARTELGSLLYDLLENKGAERKALADRLGVTGQTISNLAYGRTPRNGGNHS
jgi:hypothetical protein